MNTHYFSFYNDKYDENGNLKIVPEDRNQMAIENLEDMLKQLRAKETDMWQARNNGYLEDHYEDLAVEVKHEAQDRYDKFINDPHRENQKEK